MGRVSHLVVRMKDDWHVTDVKDSSTMKPAQIFVQVTFLDNVLVFVHVTFFFNLHFQKKFKYTYFFCF